MSIDKNKERLLALFQEKKISEAELQILLNSIDTKISFFYKVYLFLINPFQKIAGFQAFFLGILFTIVMAFCANKADVHYPDIISLTSSIELNKKLNFIKILCEQLIQCTTLALFFYIFSLIYQNGKVRLIDFLGTVYFSRFPYFIMTLYILILRHLFPNILTGSGDHPWRYAMYIFSDLGLAWQIITYFFAFKESSGLKDTRLWAGFILCIILASFTSGIIIQNIYELHTVKL